MVLLEGEFVRSPATYASMHASGKERIGRGLNPDRGAGAQILPEERRLIGQTRHAQHPGFVSVAITVRSSLRSTPMAGSVVHLGNIR